MTKGQLKQLLEEDKLPDHAEIVIEDDGADIYGIATVLEVEGRLVISTGDLEDDGTDDEDE